jgi:phytoene/squalene synthetase
MSATPESHSARYFALLYASAAQRPALEALFGIEREVFDSLRPGLDHHVAHSRLQWWREECERAAGGRAVHPLTRALVSALGGASGGAAGGTSHGATGGAAGGTSHSGVAGGAPLLGGAPALDGNAAAALTSAAAATPAEAAAASAVAVGPVTQQRVNPLPQLAGLCGIVDVAIWDLAGATFETRRELEAYCQRWAAGMIEPLVSAGRSVEWLALGAALREAELLADFAREAHNGRIRLPLDELGRANVDINALPKPPWSDAVAELIRARLKSLRNDIERNLAGLDREQQPSVRGLLVWAALTWRTAHRAERALPNRLQPGRLDAISDAWFAWRIARRATIGRFRSN